MRLAHGFVLLIGVVVVSTVSIDERANKGSSEDELIAELGEIKPETFFERLSRAGAVMSDEEDERRPRGLLAALAGYPDDFEDVNPADEKQRLLKSSKDDRKFSASGVGKAVTRYPAKAVSTKGAKSSKQTEVTPTTVTPTLNATTMETNSINATIEDVENGTSSQKNNTMDVAANATTKSSSGIKREAIPTTKSAINSQPSGRNGMPMPAGYILWHPVPAHMMEGAASANQQMFAQFGGHPHQPFFIQPSQFPADGLVQQFSAQAPITAPGTSEPTKATSKSRQRGNKKTTKARTNRNKGQKGRTSTKNAAQNEEPATAAPFQQGGPQGQGFFPQMPQNGFNNGDFFHMQDQFFRPNGPPFPQQQFPPNDRPRPQQFQHNGPNAQQQQFQQNANFQHQFQGNRQQQQQPLLNGPQQQFGRHNGPFQQQQFQSGPTSQQFRNNGQNFQQNGFQGQRFPPQFSQDFPPQQQQQQQQRFNGQNSGFGQQQNFQKDESVQSPQLSSQNVRPKEQPTTQSGSSQQNDKEQQNVKQQQQKPPQEQFQSNNNNQFPPGGNFDSRPQFQPNMPFPPFSPFQHNGPVFQGDGPRFPPQFNQEQRPPQFDLPPKRPTPDPSAHPAKFQMEHDHGMQEQFRNGPQQPNFMEGPFPHPHPNRGFPFLPPPPPPPPFLPPRDGPQNFPFTPRIPDVNPTVPTQAFPSTSPVSVSNGEHNDERKFLASPAPAAPPPTQNSVGSASFPSATFVSPHPNFPFPSSSPLNFPFASASTLSPFGFSPNSLSPIYARDYGKVPTSTPPTAGKVEGEKQNPLSLGLPLSQIQRFPAIGGPVPDFAQHNPPFEHQLRKPEPDAHHFRTSLPPTVGGDVRPSAHPNLPDFRPDGDITQAILSTLLPTPQVTTLAPSQFAADTFFDPQSAEMTQGEENYPSPGFHNGHKGFPSSVATQQPTPAVRSRTKLKNSDSRGLSSNEQPFFSSTVPTTFQYDVKYQSPFAESTPAA